MTSKFTIGDCAGGHRLENRYKNRDVSIVPRMFCFIIKNRSFITWLFLIYVAPADNFRPYLTSFQCNDHTDYINAVFVDVSDLLLYYRVE